MTGPEHQPPRPPRPWRAAVGIFRGPATDKMLAVRAELARTWLVVSCVRCKKHLSTVQQKRAQGQPNTMMALFKQAADAHARRDCDTVEILLIRVDLDKAGAPDVLGGWAYEERLIVSPHAGAARSGPSDVAEPPAAAAEPSIIIATR